MLKPEDLDKTLKEWWGSHPSIFRQHNWEFKVSSPAEATLQVSLKAPNRMYMVAGEAIQIPAKIWKVSLGVGEDIASFFPRERWESDLLERCLRTLQEDTTEDADWRLFWDSSREGPLPESRLHDPFAPGLVRDPYHSMDDSLTCGICGERLLFQKSPLTLSGEDRPVWLGRVVQWSHESCARKVY